MAQTEIHKKNKIGYMIISIIIAICIWLLVGYSDNPDISKTFHHLSVTFDGEETLKENGFVLIGKNSIPELSVKVTGKRSSLIRSLDRMNVNVNVAEIDAAGEYDLIGTVQIPDNDIRVNKTNFSTIHIVVEEYVSKEINIRVNNQNVPDNKIMDSVPTKTKVTISGAQSEVDMVEAAVVGADYDAAAQSETISGNIQLTDADGNPVLNTETLSCSDDSVQLECIIYDKAALNVEARMSDPENSELVVNTEETAIDPAVIEVGILPGSSIDYLSVKLNGTEQGEIKCKIEQTDGLFIPGDSAEVTVVPVFETAETVVREVAVQTRNIADGLHMKGDVNTVMSIRGGADIPEKPEVYVNAAGLGAGQHSLKLHMSDPGLYFFSEDKVDIELAAD